MKLSRFRVTNYRNILDSGWIDVLNVTAFVGQNEAGKSNLFEALYPLCPIEKGDYKIDEDWPVDRWGDKDPTAIVCQAEYVEEDDARILDMWKKCCATPDVPEPDATMPSEVKITLSKGYTGPTKYTCEGLDVRQGEFDGWAAPLIPKFVIIRDYEPTGTRIELPTLAQKIAEKQSLTPEEENVYTVLQLAQIDVKELTALGNTQDGRTRRTFDTVSASSYLSKQFAKLWSQKRVRFIISVDGPTLNVFVEDAGVEMPVRLERRSTGFRWHVFFAWKFTHASKGQYANCVLLLEEPGIHLHFDGQKDLLRVFEKLAESNTVLYSTHLATMIDPSFPERVRIVEVHNHHSRVMQGVVSSQRSPMAVIEARLGLTGDLSGLLGARQTLIVEGGDDALILQKLSGMLERHGKQGISDRIYLWPAEGASKTPMFAGFCIGSHWDAAVLLDSDKEGQDAKEKIKELYLDQIAEEQQNRFRVLMLKDAAKLTGSDAAIEDLFPPDFILDCVNAAYKMSVGMSDLPVDGSSMITKRIEQALQKFGRSSLDKRLLIGELLRRFDAWKDLKDLPKGTLENLESLFGAINRAFETSSPSGGAKKK